MNRATVSTRVFLLSALVLSIAAPTAVGTSVWLAEASQQRHELDQRLRLATGYIRAHAKQIEAADPQPALERQLISLGLEAQITVVNEQGKSLVFSSPFLDELQPAAQPPRTPIDKARASLAEIDRRHAEPRVDYAFPLGNSKTSAELLVTLFHAPLDRTERALLSLVAGALTLLLTLAAVAWLHGRWLVVPLRRLSSQVDGIAGGDLAVCPPRSRLGEVENVSAAISGMAAALGAMTERDAQLDERRRFFVAAVAHDLRTPLFALRSHLEALAMGIGPPDRQLSGARAKADQLERLAGNLFAYARAEYADDRPALQTARLGDLVQAAVAALEDVARSHGSVLRLGRGGETLATVDPERLERVITNLVDNAIRFTPLGGSIEVGWENGPMGPMLTVADEGPGIDEELLPHIFEPMVRAAEAREAGAGLGLAIARRLVESQGGSIEAHNRPGGGAIFTILLQRAAASTPHALAAHRA